MLCMFSVFCELFELLLWMGQSTSRAHCFVAEVLVGVKKGAERQRPVSYAPRTTHDVQRKPRTGGDSSFEGVDFL